MDNMRTKLSTLWIFATVNYIYADVVGLIDTEMLKQYLTGNINGIEINQGFLLAASALVEIPMAMIVVSRLVDPRISRWANVVAGALMTAVQVATLFIGVPAPYYAFFSAVEIATTATIVWLAWSWAVTQPVARTAAEAL
jgi:hypothetical protein